MEISPPSCTFITTVAPAAWEMFWLMAVATEATTLNKLLSNHGWTLSRLVAKKELLAKENPCALPATVATADRIIQLKKPKPGHKNSAKEKPDRSEKPAKVALLVPTKRPIFLKPCPEPEPVR